MGSLEEGEILYISACETDSCVDQSVSIHECIAIHLYLLLSLFRHR